MIETLQELGKLLSSAPLTVHEVAVRLGTIQKEQEGDWPTEVKPHDSAFQIAQVQPEMGTNEPAWVEFQLAEDVSLSIRELQTAFGAYSELKRMPARLPKIAFKLDWPDMPYTCTLIVEVETESAGNLADGHAKSILMRRDIRLT